VAVYAEPSLDALVGLLGVLKSGAAYLPLDPLYPADHLAFVLRDAVPRVVLTSRARRAALPADGPPVLALDPDADEPGADPDDTGAPVYGHRPPATALAYVLYTSGSTGRPKGVQVTHRSVVNLLAAMRREPGLGAGDVLLSVSAWTFDIAALELFLPLTTGARVVIAGRRVATDGPELARLVTESRATFMQATPATWRMLLHAGWAGSRGLTALCGGEALAPDLAEDLLARCGTVWNCYGPTETTIWSTVARVRPGIPITIGRPIANTRVYVLDDHLQPVPIGVPGELCIGGAGLARGYLNRPELTAERFVRDPFSGEPGVRLYKTGDRVRWLPDGNLEYLGRFDHQVKLRGFRIEPGEVEVALGRHPRVRAAVVLVREDRPGDHRLVAYVVPHAGAAPEPAALRAHLEERLPAYMVPSAFVILDALPVTANGKVDRRALPAPSSPSGAANAPRTPVEEKLAAIWAEVLGVPQVGVRDNFFELGGHSLLAVRLLARIQNAFGVRLSLAGVFDQATIENMAGAVERALEPGPERRLAHEPSRNRDSHPERRALAPAADSNGRPAAGGLDTSAGSGRTGRAGHTLPAPHRGAAPPTAGRKVNDPAAMGVYRFLATSDHWSARATRSIKRSVKKFSLPIPGPLFRPARHAYVMARAVWHFLCRVFVCEPFFKSYCARYGKNLHTGTFLHWVRGKGTIVVGDNVTVDGKSNFLFAARFVDRPVLTIGNATGIGHGCRFVVGKAITIGSHCRIAGGSHLFDSGGHPTDAIRRARGEAVGEDAVLPIVIHDYVWIGAGATIYPGVTIGEGAIVSAGSVVMTDVEPYTIVAGNPAGKIGDARGGRSEPAQ
jgi:amino acid adenylation domain-containing protein